MLSPLLRTILFLHRLKFIIMNIGFLQMTINSSSFISCILLGDDLEEKLFKYLKKSLKNLIKQVIKKIMMFVLFIYEINWWFILFELKKTLNEIIYLLTILMIYFSHYWATWRRRRIIIIIPTHYSTWHISHIRKPILSQSISSRTTSSTTFTIHQIIFTLIELINISLKSKKWNILWSFNMPHSILCHCSYI